MTSTPIMKVCTYCGFKKAEEKFVKKETLLMCNKCYTYRNKLIDLLSVLGIKSAG